MLNQGLVGSEIAEQIEMPPELDRAWHTHGYYGSVSHNVKAIYQRYLGWYDGNPAHLWQHPPQAAAQRYVEIIGGVDATAARAREFLDRGDLRFAAELASHAVFADPDHADGRAVLAEAFQRLGHGAECATWRNNFLTGAQELQRGIQPTAVVASAGLAPAMTTTQLFDALAIRVDGPNAWNERFALTWDITDTGERYRMELSNGALVHFPISRDRDADLTISLTRPQLLGLLGGAGHDGVAMAGDARLLPKLLAVLDDPDPDFPIVTP
jgi:alkyl sulfatase BDS1-like metallo-beta-lactamase superfamily hydrolase